MRPLRLEFQGINSFSEHTIIDFGALTRGGIFGIFGDTGSGKSTVLDSINFALYGSVERSKEKTDIINYNSDKADVKFVFDIINEGKRKTYTVERILKRDKSGTHKAMLYESDGEKETCIADKASLVERKIAEILGVEAEDFRKCIALPQGEFAQFVKSAPSERLKLIERLFGLAKYGDRLKDKLNQRQNENESVYQNLNGRLQPYEDITGQALEAAEENLGGQRKFLEKLKVLEKRTAEKYDRLKDLNGKLNELECVKKKLLALENEKPAVEELRKGISALADCGQVVKTAEERDKKQEEIDNLTHDAERLESSIRAHISSVSAIEKRLEEGGFEEKISNCVELAAKYSSCEGKAEKLAALSGELERRRGDFKKSEAEIERLFSDKAAAQEEFSKLEKEIEDLSSKDISDFINVEFKGAVLKGEYIASLDYFADFYGGVKSFKEDTPLYEYVSGELKNKIAEYRQRIDDVRGFKPESIKIRLEKLQRIEKERQTKSKELNETAARLHNLAAAITVKQNEMQVMLKEGRDLKERADELTKELERAFGKGCKDYELAVKRNEETLSALRSEKQKLEAERKSLVETKNGLIVSKERLGGLLLAVKGEYKNLCEKLGNLIKDKPFKSVEDCVALVGKFGDVADAEAKVTEFDLRFSALSSRKAELENVKGISGATDGILAAVEREKSDIYAGVTEISNKIAVLENEKNLIEKRLVEKAEILKNFKTAKAERELLSRLKEITKGNRFLEYIANEYLADISSLASSTLLKLTGGRYFLAYKDNGFYVGDNFNCGNLRGVNTLSGGETFLVSLSLALALSQTICSRSMKSIEFFFLDEGFGTLDGTLVDVVMNALEKLKSSSFTIGVISHVEELKYRIANKITVNKATESHGSTVTVSC